MAAYNFNDPAPVFQNILGTAHLATGSLTFYAIGTTTPKDTWNDPDMAPANVNANPLNLDSSGRPTVDVFMDGEYTVKLTDGPDGTGSTIWTRDIVPGVDAGLSIPALVNGEFLTNDGATLQWDAIRQVPDPTGQSGKALTSTGSGTTWTPFPSAPTLDVVIGANSLRVGDGSSSTKVLFQRGSGEAAATGTRETFASAVFDTPFTTLWHISIETQGSGFPGDIPRHSQSASAVTGFTVRFTTGENSTSSVWDINSPIPFTYLAVGTVTV